MKANLLLDKTERMPAPNSWREAVFSIVWMHRQTAEHAKVRALAQAGMEAELKDKIAALKDYTRCLFPFEEEHKKNEEKRELEAMQKWIKEGPVSIKSEVDLTPKALKRRMKRAEDIIQGRREEVRQDIPQDLGSLHEKTAYPRRATVGGTRGARALRSARRTPKRPPAMR